MTMEQVQFRSREKVPSGVTLKPANGGQGKTGQRKGRGLSCFTLSPPGEASLFLCANSADHI